MKMDVRTSVTLGLLATTVTAVAQNAAPQDQTPPTQQTPPPPAQSQPPAQPTPPAPPATPPLPRLPSQQYSPPPPQYRYQYSPAPAPQNASPPPTPPPAAPPPRVEWIHSSQPDGFQYHPLRFHIDGGGTLTQRSNDTLLDNGWNAGLGLAWFPTSHLPLGIRIDGTYNEFDARRPLLNQAAATYGTAVDHGTEKLWGGDADLELDLHLSPYVRAYLLAGGGWYKEQATFRQRNYYAGTVCWWGCGPGYYGINSIVARNTSDWHFAKNAGIGFEFATGPWSSFFVEARYMRLNPNDAKSDFLPIRAGLRF